MRAAQKRRYYEQSQRNDLRKGLRWTKAEDARITAKDRPTDRKLSKALAGRCSQSSNGGLALLQGPLKTPAQVRHL